MQPMMYYAFFYVGWIVLHFAASHFYTYHCTPLTVHGLLMSPFQVMSPQCVGSRWIVNNGGDVMTVMWMTMGTHIAFRIAKP